MYKLNEYDIFISENVLTNLNIFKQDKAQKPESGGILLGELCGNRIVIDRLSIPNKKDKFSRFNFVRNLVIAQSIINYEYYNSGYKRIYLGEWHTHPELHPSPSHTDLKMIKKVFKRSNLNTAFILLLIQGIETIYLGIYDGDKMKSVLV